MTAQNRPIRKLQGKLVKENVERAFLNGVSVEGNKLFVVSVGQHQIWASTNITRCYHHVLSDLLCILYTLRTLHCFLIHHHLV